MSPTLSIARQTFTEALRQPVYSVMLCSCVMIIHLQPPMAQYVFRAQEKLVTDAGLSVVLLGSWIAAAFCANRAINLEIESGTALLILSKPVGWFQFLLAKFIGILAAVLLFASTTGMALLITLQIAVDQYRYDFTVFYSMVAAYLGCAAGCRLVQLPPQDFLREASGFNHVCGNVRGNGCYRVVAAV